MGFDDLHLLMVGDGMSRASLEQLVKEEGLTGHVTFYGRVEAHDIPQFSELADAMVVSLAENKDLELTIPAKVASCMAAGRPIIACLDGGGCDCSPASRVWICKPSRRYRFPCQQPDEIQGCERQ